MAKISKMSPQASDAEETTADVACVVEDDRAHATSRGRRAEKIGVVASDKMEKTCVVRVDRLIKHPKYRRYVRRTSKFMAHNEKGATVGDKVRIVETRARAGQRRWRVAEVFEPDTTGRVVKPSPAQPRLGTERIKKAVSSVVKDN